MEFRNKRNHKAFILHTVLFVAIILLTGGCGKKPATLYHPFPEKVWERFNLLSFEIPVEHPGRYNVKFIVRVTPAFGQNNLPLNMVMNSPSGEERIMEYELRMKNDEGQFLSAFKGDSCEYGLLLKREMTISKPGILKIEIENLTPHPRTNGILGAGITLEGPGK